MADIPNPELDRPEAVLRPIHDYDIDPVTGFVPPTDPLDRLPPYYEAWERLVPIMAPLIRSGRIREALASMPQLDVARLATVEEEERALLLLTMFSNAWVWGGSEPNLTMPAPLAVPLCTLATKLERPPINHYGSMALRNWRRVDPDRPISADNVQMDIGFLGGVDEEWFFLASMGVELAGADLLQTIYTATHASHHSDDAALTQLVEQIARDLDPVITALERMREWCDPYIFYHRVRPFVAGWPEPGMLYEGVWDEPRQYSGGSAGQSSLIQVVDAVLGVVHDSAMTGAFFKAMRGYMPRAHRQFVEDVERASKVRARVLDGSPELQTAYNVAIAQVDRFRLAHRQMAHDYISVPSGLAQGVKGTGGTELAKFLDAARTETTRLSIATAAQHDDKEVLRPGLDELREQR